MGCIVDRKVQCRREHTTIMEENRAYLTEDLAIRLKGYPLQASEEGGVGKTTTYPGMHCGNISTSKMTQGTVAIVYSVVVTYTGCAFIG